MAETTTPRLMAAAKEFNVGKETLVDYLLGKGFDKDDLKPTSKLSEDMYRALQQEFAGDKVAKLKSDQIDLPKGSQEAKKKKEDETVVFNKIFKKSDEEKPKEEPVPVIEKAPEPVAPPVQVPPPADVVLPPVVEPVEEPVAEKTPEVQPVPEVKTEEPEVMRVASPELEGPKVFDKIDLSAIDSSTRPRKSIVKKQDEAAAKPAEPVAEPVSEKPAPQVPAEPARPAQVEAINEEVPEPQPAEEAPAVATPAADAEAGPVITNIRAEKLEGPKILGKIQLPTESDNRPKQGEEKRKRKRIPIERKDTQTPQQRAQHLFKKPEGQTARPAGGPQQGGSNFRPGQNRGPNRPGGGNRPPLTPREAKEIDKKEIQDKIRETQAKLAGSGGRGKSLKAKYRRAKRDEQSDS